MLKMLATYLYPTSGQIFIDGLDVVKEPLEVRRRIGYLAGDTPLYRDMRVDKFLQFVGAARGWAKEERKNSCERVVDLCDIDSVLLQRVSECSTGFRQRIGLATALIHDPPILLLDEPTHGFDPLQVIAFRELLRSMSTDKAILFSTHIVSDVEAISDRVLIIHLGKLLGDGRQEEVAAAAGVTGASLETVFAQLVRAAH